MFYADDSRRSPSHARRTGQIIVAASVILIGSLVGCAAASTSEPEPTVSPTGGATAAPSASADAPVSVAPVEPETEAVVGTVVRFTSERTSVDVTIGEDSPASRDFLSMLPLQLDFEDLSAREKIAYLPRPLNYEGSPGSDPEDGDLIYFTSWGNLGFYYNADGIDYSDATLHLGTYSASREQLDLLEGQPVTIEVVG